MIRYIYYSIDDFVLKADKKFFQGNIIMNNNKITGLADKVSDTDAVSVGQARGLINLKQDPVLNINGNKRLSLGEPVSDTHAARLLDIKNIHCVKEGTLNFTPGSLTQKVIQFSSQIILKPPKIIVIAFYIWSGNRWLTELYYIQFDSIYFTSSNCSVSSLDFHLIYIKFDSS